MTREQPSRTLGAVGTALEHASTNLASIASSPLTVKI